MNHEEKTSLQQTADALLQNTVTVKVQILQPTLLQKLRKQTTRTFHIQPACLGTLIKISKELLSIDIDEADKANWMVLSQKLMYAHSSTLARIIAFAIVNSKADPPQSLIDFLQYNLTASEMSHVAKIVLEKMDITSFIGSIVSIKGVNLLETSLPNQGG
jgi:hypothetical protein